MSNNLTLLVVVPGDAESPMYKTVNEWNRSNLFGSVGWLSADIPNQNGTFEVNIESHNDGGATSSDFFELLTSKIWDAVTVVGLRDRKQIELGSEYFLGELCLLELVRQHLAANKDVVVRGVTVGIADEPQRNEAFTPQWDIHILLEPKLYIDTQIASQPLVDDYRASSVLLMGVLASGGFRWQSNTLIGELKDPSIAMKPNVRIARANLRVVNAGRLTDRILEGAFPESGPWSQPSDVRNGVAMPMGAHIPLAVVESLTREARFEFEPWEQPKRKSATKVGIVQGVLLFLRHFLSFLRQVPLMIVDDFKRSIGDKIANAAQHLTFGSDSDIQLAYNPNSNLSSDAVLELVRRSGMPELDSPIADSRPWKILRSTSLGLIDGGKLPDGIHEPLRGSSRMLFLDPNCIGPQISDMPFKIDEKLRKGLNLPEDLKCLEALDVENFRMIRARIVEQLSSAQSDGTVTDDSSSSSESGEVDGAGDHGVQSLDKEILQTSIADLDAWLDKRKNSLLWNVASCILTSSDIARKEMSEAFRNIPERDIAMDAEIKAHEKVRKWTLRGLVGVAVVTAISIMGLVFAIFSLLVAIGIAVTYIFGFVMRCATLARDLAALQFTRVKELENAQQDLLRGQHAAKELVRLLSARAQLSEWQEIIREVIHAPFGRTSAFTAGKEGISSIECPPQFVLASSDPSEDQMTAAMSGAKDQTIHAGWLNETYETLVRHWSDLYKKWSAAGAGDDLSPEMDNVDSGAVRGFRPLTKEPLLYPRSDFHRAVLSGSLRDGLVQNKVEQIASSLRRTPLKELLSHVSVIGLGRALSGQSVDKFLDGLQASKDEIPSFDADLFSVNAIALRSANLEMSLPPAGQTQTHALSESVRPGEELVAVSARIDLSFALPLQDLNIGKHLRLGDDVVVEAVSTSPDSAV